MVHFVITAFFLYGIFTTKGVIAVRYIDLSYEVDANIPYWPSLGPYQMDVLNNGTTEGGYWFQLERISTSTHYGTHLDAPCHFSKGRWSVEQIPLDRLISTGVMVDVSEKALKDSDYQVTVEDLQEWEKRHGELPHGCILLIRTGWSKHWPNKSLYTGTDTNDTTKLHFPGVSPQAAEWIAMHRNISGLGIEALSIDRGQERNLTSHRILAARNVYNLENVADMSELSYNGFMLHVMPAKLKGASGAPCRIIASIPDDQNTNNAVINYSQPFKLLFIVLYLLNTNTISNNLL